MSLPSFSIPSYPSPLLGRVGCLAACPATRRGRLRFPSAPIKSSVDFLFFFAYATGMALTRRQKEVVDFIAKFVDENGYSPSYEEIARALNLASLATVHKHITALQTKNYLKRGHNQSRSVDLAPKYLVERQRMRQQQSLEVPLLGRIAAGVPVESYQDRATLSFADFLGSSDTFALEVRGDSMIEDHICDRDVILAQRTTSVHDGDIVVALVGGSETTLKRIYREPNGLYRLQPANSTMRPIFVRPEDLEIQGRLLAVLRKY